jgi:hypothetical protein
MRSDVIDKSVQHLYYLMEMLEQNGVRAWIDFGTLLGAYREKNLISHDRDIDIGVLSEDVAAVEKVLSTLKAEKKILNLSGGLWEHNSIYQFGFSPQLLKIDIYVYATAGTRVSTVHFKGFSFHRFYIDELDKIQLGKFSFNCPRHLPQYLSLKYGSDYMTPQARCEKLNVSWDDVVDNVGSDKERYTAYLPLYDLPIDGALKSLCGKIKSGFDRVLVGLCTDEQLSAYQLQRVSSYENRLEELKTWTEVDGIKGGVPLRVSLEFLEGIGADYIVMPRDRYELLKGFLDIPETHLHLLNSGRT